MYDWLGLRSVGGAAAPGLDSMASQPCPARSALWRVSEQRASGDWWTPRASFDHNTRMFFSRGGGAAEGGERLASSRGHSDSVGLCLYAFDVNFSYSILQRAAQRALRNEAPSSSTGRTNLGAATLGGRANLVQSRPWARKRGAARLRRRSSVRHDRCCRRALARLSRRCARESGRRNPRRPIRQNLLQYDGRQRRRDCY